MTDKLIQTLLEKHLMSEEEIKKHTLKAKLQNQNLFQIILQYQLIDPKIFAENCASLFSFPLLKLETTDEKELAFKHFPLRTFKNHLLLPIKKTETEFHIAICNPNDIDLTKTLSFQIGLPIKIFFVKFDTLYRLHNLYLSEETYRNLNEKKDQLPKILTYQLLSDAIHRHASDIHIEPFQLYLRIRFRLDGLLQEITRLPTHFTDAIISCIKVLGHLDIAIKRMPQDGRLSFQTYLGFVKDCRISTCPTLFGEKIVIRLLDANTQIRPLQELGLTQKNQDVLHKIIEQPQGLILVTGPTGSGKTITLYALLNLLNQSRRNITTIEDPIEMQMEGINQTAINLKMGLTFPNILRALLRQDPDIIMIGEIRDQETAEMAIRAAQTGHLVLSTLHTNSAAEAITRLTQMNIAPYHLIGALTLVIAQRLIRKLCDQCKIFHAFDNTYKPNGCTYCNNGFHGRFGVFELMPINNELKEMILKSSSSHTLSQKNQKNGHCNLWQSGLLILQDGLTSLCELYRVIPYE